MYCTACSVRPCCIASAPSVDTLPSHDAATVEVMNTQRLHQLLPSLDPFMANDFRRAHAELMHGLAMDAGSYRTGPVEVVYDDHFAPRTASAENLASQMEQLLYFVDADEAPLLITTCVLHYGILHLRPFSAGNGRMARLWQKRVLMRHWPVFAFLPVEAFILRSEATYQAAIAYADNQEDCGGFITYMMEQLDQALAELLAGQRPLLSSAERVTLFLTEKDRSRFSRKDYRLSFPELSTATASRDLAEAVRAGRIGMSGSGRNSVYRTLG